MNEVVCGERVEYALPWAGKILDVCKYHSVALVKMAAVIGSPIEVRGQNTNKICQQQDIFTDVEKRAIGEELFQILGIE